MLMSTIAFSSHTLAATVNISNYQVVGNGAANDRSGFNEAINDLLSHSDSETKTLNLQAQKTYYLGRSVSGNELDQIFDLSNVSNVVINGNHSTLLLERYDMAAFINQSKNITIKNLKLDYKTPTFTQGIVSQINTSQRTFTVTVQDGYPLPTDAELSSINARAVNSPWANSATASSSGQFLRINIFIKRVDIINRTSRQLKITYIDSTSTDDINQLQNNQLFAFRTHGGTEPGHMVRIHKSEDVTLENVSIYNTMKMGIGGGHNEGTIRLTNIKIQPKPGTNRIVSAVSDGIHLKSNRAQVIIENSLIERNLDDAVNLGSMAEVIQHWHSATDIEIRDVSIQYPSYVAQRAGNFNFESPELKVGDEVYAFNYDSDNEPLFLGKAKILTVAAVLVNGNNKRVRRITLDNAIHNMVPLDEGTGVAASASNVVQRHATRIFIPNVSNPNFIIRNNTFRNKTRSGVLARGKNGLIRGNSFSNLDGYGVLGQNSLTFNENNLPLNMEISANYFENTRLWAIILGVGAWQNNKPSLLPSHSQIVNNRFNRTQNIKMTDEISTRIHVKNVADINVSGNVFFNVDSDTDLLNAANVTSNAFLPLWKRNGQAGIYFVSNDSYCHIPSMSRLTNIWGSNWQDFLTTADDLPVQRVDNGTCRQYEGVIRLTGGGIYRYNHDNTMCNYGSMHFFRQSTGIIVNAASLPVRSEQTLIDKAQGAKVCPR
ncbi:hypothetical protein EYS14_04740 [Alteromonadaceae bacterium M269]|nr:hypothetical protein EYS14_04740 [Alteromonadaceae bacterium M269]